MWSWTASVSPLQAFHTARQVRMYELPADNPQHRPVIVKQLHCPTEDEALRAMEEGRIAKANPHPNICECLDFVREGAFVYVVLVKMPRSFEDEVRDRRNGGRRYFSEEELWTVYDQLLAAYAFLQTKVTDTQNIAHRDVKPHNILLDLHGDVKVCDFGFAKELSLSSTEMHTLLGTEPFFSPALRERLISGDRDVSRVQHNLFKSDVYSLGVCMLYATLLQTPPFLTQLSDLQSNIGRCLDGITHYSELWVGKLRAMLTVEEQLRPDFDGLQKMPKYADDEPIPAIEIDSEETDPLLLTAKCGLSFVRVSTALVEVVPCLVSIVGKASDPTKRTYPTDIVCVIDESGSMTRARMQLVKDTISKFVCMLTDRDRLSIVTFSHHADRRCPLTACSDSGKSKLKECIGTLRGRDYTNISAGFLLALEVVAQRRISNPASILLFSDGENTHGPEPLSACLAAIRSGVPERLTVHTFGYGDEVDIRLLEALATEGKGQFYHIHSLDDIEKAFAFTFGTVTSVVARNITVSVEGRRGPVAVTIPEVYTKDRAESFTLPDLTANQQKDMVFVLRPGYQSLPKGVSLEPVAVSLTYTDIEGMDHTQSANLKVKFVPWTDAAPSRDITVFVNWYRVKGAYCLQEARELADAHSYSEAERCLCNGIDFIRASDHADHRLLSPLLSDLESAIALVQSNESWVRGGDARFTSVSYSHMSQVASACTPQYMSVQQERSVAVMQWLSRQAGEGGESVTRTSSQVSQGTT